MPRTWKCFGLFSTRLQMFQKCFGYVMESFILKNWPDVFVFDFLPDKAGRLLGAVITFDLVRLLVLNDERSVWAEALKTWSKYSDFQTFLVKIWRWRHGDYKPDVVLCWGPAVTASLIIWPHWLDINQWTDGSWSVFIECSSSSAAVSVCADWNLL